MKISLVRLALPLLTLWLSAASVPGVVPIPAEDKNVRSLNGAWRFKLEQAPAPPHFLGANGKPIPANYPTNFESFYLPAYHEDSSWHDLQVPGNWEMAGYSPATYHQPDNASGFYRLRFEMPASWKGRLVKINFDGVQNGCEIWCNGKPVAVEVCSWGRTNYHECGWTAWQADLTPAVKFGQANLLALRVIKNTKGVDCDTGDYFFLGGVHRPVTLFSLPPSFMQDLTIRTKLLDQGSAAVTVIAQLNQPRKGAKVTMHLEGQPTFEAEPDAAGRAVLTQTVRNAKLWSAEFPNLYNLAIDLKDGSKVREHVERRVGIREVSTADGVFRVNGVPVKLAGICRHDVYPTLGTALGPEVWKKDLTLMKAANFNAIRTSHYPYGSGFYDLCDEMGFYVLDEEPFCWVNCDDPVLMPAFEQRARETVARDKNHACVVIWGIGNENKPGRDNTLAAHITRELDPTRPRLVSCQKAEDGGADVEFDDEHYITPKSIDRAEHSPRRAKIPMIYTENPNVWDVRNGPDYGSLDMWAPVIDRTWREIWNDEHVCGTFLWEWQDRAVADKCPTKYYYYFPDSGINLLKVKGVVDGFRNPRPEYYHIKMAQTPIALSTNLQVLADAAVLDVNNRYSFTDLSELRVHWQLLKASRRLAEADTQASLPPRSKGEVRLALPGQSLSNADTLRVDVAHPAGWNVVTYEFALKPSSHTTPAVQAVSGLKFPKFIFLTGKRVRDDMGWWKLDGQPGELVDIKVQRRGAESAPVDSTALADLLLADVTSLEADVRLPSNSVPVAHLHAEISGGKLNYQFTWSGEKSDIYELGWEFAGPKGVDRFSWDREALWSYYPPNHIGRPRGTAMPDSARAELTKVERPDAFDFNSTKFNCNWASLTDSSGRGLCFVFSPGQRQHVRGAVDAQGNCSLIVNRCYSPPRDISSPIVEDLYTVLKKGETVEGSLEINALAEGSARKGSARVDLAPTPAGKFPDPRSMNRNSSREPL